MPDDTDASNAGRELQSANHKKNNYWGGGCPNGAGFGGVNAKAFPSLGLLCGTATLYNNGECLAEWKQRECSSSQDQCWLRCTLNGRQLNGPFYLLLTISSNHP